MQLKTDRILVAFAFAILIFMCFKYLFKGKIGTNSSQHTEGGIHRWQIATTWNNNLPLLQTNIEKMLYEIETQTEHKLIISITDTPKDASGNAISLSNPLNLLHAVSKGELQGVHAAAYYWKNEIPAAVYFGSVPFGLEHGEVKQWLDNGGLKQ